MKRNTRACIRNVLAVALALLFLCACQPQAEPSAAPEPSQTLPPTEAPTPLTETEPATREDGARQVELLGQSFWLSPEGRILEPDWTLDIDTMHFSDFGKTFAESYPVKTDRYKLMEGTEYEITVYHIASDQEGPTVYLVAGIHGDENAGWYAGNLMREASVSCGELYVLSPANVTGAAAHKRCLRDTQDLNRSFPGNPNGTDAQKVAWAIYSDIRDKQPVFVFDLHEAIVYREDRDFLGSNLIFSPNESLDIRMLVELQFATEMGEVGGEPFSLNGPGPAGSINSTVSSQLKILTLTVETFRGFPIEYRVNEQLEIIEFILNYLGMRG